MAYSKQVLDHYDNPRNVGKWEPADNIGTGMVGAPACGDVMRLQIKVEEQYNRLMLSLKHTAAAVLLQAVAYSLNGLKV